MFPKLTENYAVQSLTSVKMQEIMQKTTDNRKYRIIMKNIEKQMIIADNNEKQCVLDCEMQLS